MSTTTDLFFPINKIYLIDGRCILIFKWIVIYAARNESSQLQTSIAPKEVKIDSFLFISMRVALIKSIVLNRFSKRLFPWLLHKIILKIEHERFLNSQTKHACAQLCYDTQVVRKNAFLKVSYTNYVLN